MIPTELIHKIKTESDTGNVIVCIAGRSCSGKTTLANALQKELSDLGALVIHQDFWYKDFPDIPRSVYGYPDMESEYAFEVEEFKKDIINLIFKGYINVPRYDIATNTRLAKDIEIKSSKIIIIEGLHVNDIFRDLASNFNTIYVMLDTSIDKCAIRRAERDTKLFNIEYNRVLNHYKNILVPCYKKWYARQIDITKNKLDKGIIIYD